MTGTINPNSIEFGLDSFGEVTTDGSGRPMTDAEAVRLMIDEAVLAESVGIDSFNIGEHYRPDMVDSASHVILAAIAGKTETLRLGTAVTVLSTQDPVRVYANFATLDAVSNGRAQLIVGRASSIESFALFGLELDNYETLFEEKLDLFTRLLREQPVSWEGTTRSALSNQFVRPAVAAGNIPTWVGVGGSPESVVRAARYDLPLMLAIIGGDPGRFRPFVDLYYEAMEKYGHAPKPVGMHSIGLVAETDEAARAAHWPHYRDVMAQMVKERGFHMPTFESYEREITQGALFVGSPETVAQKIAANARTLDLSRFDLKHDIGKLPSTDRARTITLFGREVIPRVRELLRAD
ncbi:MAG: class flavin-dependent oxidoreductase [Devosia sp.]|uniref:LLM class flavin-dependent oxidoreductase n=1 Tax=Devosia sp. TaxID=1871048 RepID=UPI00261D6DC7|nr:LLM class flavin-dependent oxidoreductase [Devosia sp.]MDB5527383.1 class flavin-dependent oxidoreductase [Devosia sp.]